MMTSPPIFIDPTSHSVSYKDHKLGEIFVEKEYLSFNELQGLFRVQKFHQDKKIGSLARELFPHKITEKILNECLADQKGIIDYKAFETYESVQWHLIADWQNSHAFEHYSDFDFLPLLEQEDTIFLGILDIGSNVEELGTFEENRFGFEKSWRQFFYSQKKKKLVLLTKKVKNFLLAESLVKVKAQGKKLIAIKEVEEHAPTKKFLNELLDDSIEAGASDIHFKPIEQGINVALRVNGVLRNYHATIQERNGGYLLPRDHFVKLVELIKNRAELKVNVADLPQDGRMTYFSEKLQKSIQLRVSTLPCVLISKNHDSPEKIVMRLLDMENITAVTLDDLLVHPKTRNDLKSSLQEGSGIILVTGPTGSGKSTTLYTGLQNYNFDEKNVSTVEDPVEYFLDGLTQVEIEGELTFAKALRSLMRQDPDVIFIGEIRDEESAKIAVSAALTGHMVLSTVHAKDPLMALERMSQLTGDMSRLQQSLSYVSSQRLKQKLCGHCAMEASPAEVESVCKQYGFRIKGGFIPNLKGCGSCVGGFKGRVGVVGYFKINSDIVSAMQKNDFVRMRSIIEKDFYSIESARDDLIEKGILNLFDVEW